MAWVPYGPAAKAILPFVKMGASIQDIPLFDTYVEEPQWNKFLTAALACQWGEAQPLPGSGANYGLAVASVTAILRSQGGRTT